jgi:hypothetical protein
MIVPLTSVLELRGLCVAIAERHMEIEPVREFNNETLFVLSEISHARVLSYTILLCKVIGQEGS